MLCENSMLRWWSTQRKTGPRRTCPTCKTALGTLCCVRHTDASRHAPVLAEPRRMFVDDACFAPPGDTHDTLYSAADAGAAPAGAPMDLRVGGYSEGAHALAARAARAVAGLTRESAPAAVDEAGGRVGRVLAAVPEDPADGVQALLLALRRFVGGAVVEAFTELAALQQTNAALREQLSQRGEEARKAEKLLEEALNTAQAAQVKVAGLSEEKLDLQNKRDADRKKVYDMRLAAERHERSVRLSGISRLYPAYSRS